MKIQLDENEVYEIKIPDEIDTNEFLILVEKFNNLGKLVTQFGLTKQENKNSPINLNKQNSGKNPFFNTRKKVLDIFQYWYLGTEQDKKRITEIIGINKDDLTKRFNGLRLRYNIKPQEVGLIRFRDNKGNPKIPIKDYVIKSYTGLFDENGKENSQEDNEEKNKK